MLSGGSNLGWGNEILCADMSCLRGILASELFQGMF